MQSFKIAALLLLGYFWLVKEEEENLLILIATLATTEVSAGAVAKADQYKYFLRLLADYKTNKTN